jgi:hypothetical protein
VVSEQELDFSILMISNKKIIIDLEQSAKEGDSPVV